jgi:alkylhydroperoxidase family enzyme
MAAVANIEVVQREAAIQEDVGDLPKADIETALMVAASECVCVFCICVSAKRWCQLSVVECHNIINKQFS